MTKPTAAKANVVPVKPFKAHSLSVVTVGGERFLWIGANLLAVYAEKRGR